VAASHCEGSTPHGIGGDGDSEMAKDELRAGVVHFSGDEVSRCCMPGRGRPEKIETSRRVAEGAMLRTASSPSKRSEPADRGSVAGRHRVHTYLWGLR